MSTIAPPRDHGGQQERRQLCHRAGIEVDQAPHPRGIAVGDRPQQADAGIVDQHVDLGSRTRQPLGQPGRSTLVRQVQSERRHLSPVLGVQPLGLRLQACAVPCDQDQVHALPGQPLGDRGPDACRGAGHDCSSRPGLFLRLHAQNGKF
nr:hypothetical protein [Streptomyces humidus]